jgi:hypothetical protein
MTRFMLSIAVFAFVGGSLLANPPSNDSNKPELVIIGDPGNALEQSFATHPGLKTVRDNCLYTPLKLSDPLYKLRYATSISGTPPMVLLQRPGGGVIYAADMPSLPYSSDAIYEALKSAYERAREADLSAKQAGTPEDCPDGTVCPPPNQIDAPEWSINPFNIAKPKPVVEGWFSDTVTWMMVLVGVSIALGFMLIFGLIGLGVVLLLNRFLT